uniref:Major sperm protein n=1 Tax=Panagrellus redivivus TaxID=6233 RepID=A0A7E4ZY27_PANRE
MSILGLYDVSYRTAHALTPKEKILKVKAGSKRKLMVLEVFSIAPPKSVKTKYGVTPCVQVTFRGADPTIMIHGTAFGRSAERITRLLSKKVRVQLSFLPDEPMKDIFDTPVQFSIKLNLDTRISCAGIEPLPTQPRSYNSNDDFHVEEDDEPVASTSAASTSAASTSSASSSSEPSTRQPSAERKSKDRSATPEQVIERAA